METGEVFWGVYWGIGIMERKMETTRYSRVYIGVL